MNRKAIFLASVASLLLAMSVFLGIRASLHQNETKIVVLQIKKDAFQLDRNVEALSRELAIEEVVKMENRLLSAESTLRPGDEQFQHWLDQSHDLVLSIHEKIKDKKIEKNSVNPYGSSPSFLY